MISVQVRDHNGHCTVESESRVHHLPLGPFPAVEEKEFSISTQSDRGETPFFGGKTATSTQEDDIDTCGHLVWSQH